MLPRKIIVNQKARRVWLALFLLAPLAYAGGVLLILRDDPSVKIGLQIDRPQAISLASQDAASRGVNVTGWDSFCRFKPENNLLFYYRLKSGPERDLARRLAPSAAFGVRFRSPNRNENIEVLLDTDGRQLGFSRNISKSVEAAEVSEEDSRKVAQASLQARLAENRITTPVELKPDASPNEQASGRDYTWKLPLSPLPELNLQGRLSVRGGVLIADRIQATIDDAYARKELHSSKTLRIISGILYGLTVLIVLIFGIYRFVQRAQQKEVSYSRVFLLSFIFAVVMSGFILITDVAIYDLSAIPNFPAPDWSILFSSSMIYVIVGLFMGLAYGSGEGDIREAYPGKLTSLDALMTGKLFSRNVARAVVSGWVLGGWILLLTNAVALIWRGNPVYGKEYGPLDAWFGKAPWLSSLMIWPMDVVLIIVIGLLIPLPFFHRRLRSRRLIILCLGLFVWVACTGPYLSDRPWAGVLLLAVLRAALTLVGFFQFDLLTVIVALASPTFVFFVASMMAQPAATISNSGRTSLFIALIALAIEIVFLFKGRFYREDEVRPIYAKHLAERLSMQAEVSAAREAQRRLMPRVLPKSDYFSVAASCLPAYEVGGDYYDVFELEPGKLGVLVAEGGGKGLGSALSIAFAKGFLMPKILNQGGGDDSPTEIIRSLQDRLQTKLEEDGSVGLAYAVIDAGDGSVRYARTGSHPSVLVAQGESDPRLTRPQERLLKFKSNLKADADVTITEGSFSLQPGESIIFYTDGIAKDWTNHGASPEIEIGKIIAESNRGTSEQLQEMLTKNVTDCSKRARKRGLEDDLTAVIIRLDSAETGPEGAQTPGNEEKAAR